MNKYFPVLNSILVITSCALLYLTIQIWQPSALENKAGLPMENAVPKTLKPLNIQPPNYTDVVMGDVVGQNFFRKERKPYIKPIIKNPPPSPSRLPQVAQRKSPIIPPPKYVLSGVWCFFISKNKLPFPAYGVFTTFKN